MFVSGLTPDFREFFVVCDAKNRQVYVCACLAYFFDAYSIN